jgi:hypothetical protein
MAFLKQIKSYGQCPLFIQCLYTEITLEANEAGVWRYQRGYQKPQSKKDRQHNDLILFSRLTEILE